MARRGSGIALFLAAATIGCGGADSDTEGASVESWVLGPASIEIGSIDGADALEPVRAAAVGPDGRVYIVQAQSSVVRTFLADGTASATIGHQGEGPGEFLLPASLGFMGDTLWVQDLRQRRLSLFALDGTPIEERLLPETPEVAEGESISFSTIARDGTLLFSGSPAFQTEPSPGQRYPLLARRTDGTVDTLATLDMANRMMVFVGTSGGEITSIDMHGQPYSDVTIWTLGPEASRIAVVDRPTAERADSAAYRVTVTTLRGDTVYTTEVPYVPTPVASSETDSILEGHRAAGRDVDEVREQIFLPPFHPEVVSAEVARDGSVWVRRRDDESGSRRWDVFDPSGRLIASAEASAPLALFSIDAEGVWAVRLDELDVPFVGRHPIQARAGG